MYKSHGKEYIENNFTQEQLAALMKSAPSPPAIPTVVSMKQEALSPKRPLPVLDFGCNMCGSKFLTRTKLLLHMQTHGVILVPCQTCGDKFMSQIELQTHINQVHKHRSGKKAAPMPRRKPGPASKTNAPADKRGSTSLPTYLQLTQVSRRSSLASIKSEVESKSSGGAMDVIAKLLSAAASKQVTSEERPTCNFCPLAFKGQAELSAHLVNDHFKGLVPQIQMAQPPISSEKCPNCPRTFATKDHLESHVKTVHRAKQIRRSLGLDGQVFRRPCPKRMKTHYYNHDQGSRLKPCHLGQDDLPSDTVLSSSRTLVASLTTSCSAQKALQPVILTSTVPKKSFTLRPPSHVVNMMLSGLSASAGSSGSSISERPPSSSGGEELLNDLEENNNNNNNNNVAHSNLMMSINAMKAQNGGILRKKSECPVCGIVLSPKTNVNVHLRTHSGVRPYECVLCLNRFRQKAHLMKHFRCTHNQKQPPHICLFCNIETATSNDLYRHITDQHQKETDELRPSLLAARSDAAQAAKEAQELARKEEELKTTIIEEAKEAMKLERMNEERELKMELEQMQAQAKAQAQADQEDVRYEPITEDFMFEDMVISPCYVVLPHVSEEEVDAACNPPEVNEFCIKLSTLLLTNY